VLQLKNARPFPFKPAAAIAKEPLGAHSQTTKIASWVISPILEWCSCQWFKWKCYIYGENISVMQMDREDRASQLDL